MTHHARRGGRPIAVNAPLDLERQELAGALPQLSDSDRELVDLMIRNGWSIEDAEAEVIAQLAEAIAAELLDRATEAARA